jgi:SanA protein
VSFSALKILVNFIKVTILLGLAVLILPRLLTALYALPRTFTVEAAPPAPVAIVFGAGLGRDGSPTRVLKDRIDTAARLYFAGKVKKILMSGDNSYIEYNEPGAMQEYAISLGVPQEDIVQDYAGRRTYDTCYRAFKIFDIREALVVTQSFHLPRAVYTCNALGIKAMGVLANVWEYRTSSLAYWNLRELPATLTALVDVHLLQPVPILGKTEPIFPEMH